MNQKISLNVEDLNSLIEAAAMRGAEIALARSSQQQMLNKAGVKDLLGVSYPTLRKLAATPGFPMAVQGRYSRSELEAWLTKGGAR